MYIYVVVYLSMCLLFIHLFISISVNRYTPIHTCLHRVPAAIEERGSDWPEEWPNRLVNFPDWLGDLQGRLHADQDHWKSVVERSYLNGMGIDWSMIRNVMDMKAIYGG